MSEENTVVTEENEVVDNENEKVEDNAKGQEDIAEKLYDKDDGEKDEEVNKEEDNQEEEKSKKDEGAPESYEDFVLPEGMDLDSELMEQAKPLFKELNLTQEQAQKLVDLQTRSVAEQQERMEDSWRTTLEEWANETKNDKEFGGKAFEENVAVAKAALKEFATDDFKEMLNFTGVGNHKEMVRFLYRVGKAISNDKILQGSRSPESTKDPAKILFPDMN